MLGVLKFGIVIRCASRQETAERLVQIKLLNIEALENALCNAIQDPRNLRLYNKVNLQSQLMGS
jgi:hypothetical protein